MKRYVMSFALVLGAAAAAQAQLLYTIPALSHPNGNASANPLAVDNRDYGLRLDNGNVQTFHFENVQMSFFAPAGPPSPASIYATLTGTIAHLQSSNGVSLGYAANSGLDALDQRWTLSATFRLIGREGTFGGGAPVPYAAMLSDLISGGVGGGQIEFNDVAMSLTPVFNEGVTPAVYTGPRSWSEKFNGDGDAFVIQYRHRLTDPAFAGAPWNVNAAAGWLMPTQGSGGATNDFLFYLGAVPEPATLGMLLIGLPWIVRRRPAR